MLSMLGNAKNFYFLYSTLIFKKFQSQISFAFSDFIRKFWHWPLYFGQLFRVHTCHISTLAALKNKVQSKNNFSDRISVNCQCIFHINSIFAHFAGRRIRNIKMCKFQTGSRNIEMSYI